MFAIVAVHSKPVDPVHFDDYYPRVHIPMAKKFPGVLEVRYGHVDADPENPDAPYVICNVFFPDRATYEIAEKSPEMAEALADIPNFSTGGMKLHFVDFDNFHPDTA